jgi:tape measure domain-containing protein
MASILDELLVLVGLDFSDFQSGQAAMKKQLDELRENVDDTFANIAEAGKGLVGLGTALTIGITAPLVGLVTSAIKADAEMDQLMKGLQAAAKTGEDVTKTFQGLEKAAELPGLNLKQAVEASISLQTVGLSAKESQRYIEQFGNALAAVGKGAPQLNLVVTQLQQMINAPKVLSQDLRPIIQQVPQVAAILTELYGTFDPEKLQKMGISGRVAAEQIVEGLEKVPRVGTSIANSFENLSDSVSRSLAQIGKDLRPVTMMVTDAMATVTTAIKEAATWFESLPVPVQAGAIAFVALVAALGPVLVAVGGLMVSLPTIITAMETMVAVLGVSAAGFVGWGVAIAAGVAALVALGVWVYQHWEPITAVISAAIEDVEIIANGVWLSLSEGVRGFITGFLGAMGQLGAGLKQAFGDVFTIVSGWFASLFGSNGIAGKMLGYFIDDVKDLWSLLSKLPGASGLKNLGQVWDDATAKMKAAQAAADAAQKKLEDAAKAANVHGKAVADAGEATQQYITRNTDRFNTYQKAVLDAWKANKDIAELQSKMNLAMADSWEHITGSAKEYAGIAKDLGLGVDTIGDAYKTLGITMDNVSEKSLQKQIDAFETLKNSGITYTDEMAQAIKAVYQDIEKAMEKSLGNMDSAQLDALNEQLRQIRDYANDHGITLEGITTKTRKEIAKEGDAWKTFAKQVSTIVTDLGRDISDALFSGDWMGMIEDIGKALVRAFVEFGVTQGVNVLVAAIKKNGGLMSVFTDLGGVIKDAWDGLKGMISSAASVAGNAAGGVASTAGAAASTAGTVASTAGSAASTAGSAAGGAASAVSGVASSLMSTVNMISGIAGAVGSIGGAVLSIFQARGAAKINENIQDIMSDVVAHLTDKGISQFFWENAFPVWTDTANKLGWIYDFLREWIFDRALAPIAAALTGGMAGTPAAVGGGGIGTINFYISGAGDPDAISKAVMQKLQLAGFRT